MAEAKQNRASVFRSNRLIETKTAVPQAGWDNHLGILGSAADMSATTGSAFLPGSAPGQGQLLMSHDNTNKISGSRNENIGVDEIVAIGNNEAVTIGNNASEQVGVAKVIDVGTTLLIKAGTSITLQCGASTIHMNQAGVITISGVLVTMAGAVNANVAAPITNIAGAILLTNTGAINLNTGVALNKIMGAVTTVDGTPVLINS
jgi:hypothetical protein